MAKNFFRDVTDTGFQYCHIGSSHCFDDGVALAHDIRLLFGFWHSHSTFAKLLGEFPLLPHIIIFLSPSSFD